MIVFADSSGLASFVDDTQIDHVAANQEVHRVHDSHGKLVTTNYVLAELTALFTRPLRIPKSKQLVFFQRLRSSSWIDVIHIDEKLDSSAWKLWSERTDKDWSLVDCASFAVMQQYGITEALTTDHHFEQAGFIRLLIP